MNKNDNLIFDGDYELSLIFEEGKFEECERDAFIKALSKVGVKATVYSGKEPVSHEIVLGKTDRKISSEAYGLLEKMEKPELTWWSSVLGHAAAIGLLPHLERMLPAMYEELEDEDFAQEREGSAPLWGLCAEHSLGVMSTALSRICDVLVHTQRVIERSDTEK